MNVQDRAVGRIADADSALPIDVQSYDEAMGQLQELVLRLEQGGITLEELRGYVSRCDRLIRYCHAELRSVREEVDNITDQWSKLDRDGQAI